MGLPRVQLRFWWLVVAVAIVALPLAWLDRADAVALFLMSLVALVPVAFARTGRRLEVAYWVAALHPLMVLVYLYATWFTAWSILGHRPRRSLDDPKYISPFVDVPYAMTLISFLAWPISVGAGFALVFGAFLNRARAYPLIILPLAGLAASMALMSDPLWVLDWFMD